MVLVGGYMRVSSKGERDPDKWLTIPMQNDAIVGGGPRYGYEIADLRSDVDVSGGSEKRPNLEELVARIEAGELGGLVVGKVDRFTRSLFYGVNILRRIDDVPGAFFIAAGDGIDSRVPEQRTYLNMLMVWSDHELRRFKTGWRQARERMVLDSGQHWGPNVPFGYMRGDDSRLHPHPKEAALARELFARRAAGESFSDLSRWLDELDVRTGRGGRPSRRWIAELITRRVYLGEAHAGELRNKHAHEPLVDRVTWERAQKARGPRPAKGEPTLFGGLVRCWACRHMMSSAWSPLASGRKRAYRCRVKHAHGDCPRGAFAMEEQLEELVMPVFWELLGDLLARPAAGAAADRRLVLEKERDGAARELELYRDESLIDDIGVDVYRAGMRKRSERLTVAQRALDAHDTATAPVLAGVKVTSLRERWDEIDVATRRRMLHAVIGVIVVQAPEVRRDHSVPLGRRTRLLATADVPVGLPKPGGNPQPVVSFPRFDDPACPWMVPG